MTTRETSIEAYHRACADGALTGARRQVYGWLTLLVWNEDPTSAEVLFPHVDNINLWRARFTELTLIGAISATGTRKCKITGRLATTWRANMHPWTPPERRESDRELLREALEHMDRDDTLRDKARAIRERMQK